MVQHLGERAGQGLALSGGQRREQFVLDPGQQSVEPPQLCAALLSDRDDVAAAVGLIGGPLDQPLGLTGAGRATYDRVRGAVEQITARIFDFPDADLETGGRVLAIVTARANALLAGRNTPAAPA